MTISLLPVLTALAWTAPWSASERALAACWILPNGWTYQAPWAGACPIPRDAVVTALLTPGGPVAPSRLDSWLAGRATPPRSVAIEMLRSGRHEFAELPLHVVDAHTRRSRWLVGCAIAALVLALPLALAWTSRADPVFPISAGYGGFAAVLAAATANWSAPGVTSAVVLAACVGPFVLFHLALVFPRERAMLRAAPSLRRAAYFPLLGIVPPVLFALHHDATVWPAAASLLLALGGAAWTGLVVSCLFAMRESASRVERARARLLAVGATLLPLFPSRWLASPEATLPDQLTLYVVCGALTLPLPIALCVTSYNLFDLDWDVRRRVGRALHVFASAALLTLAFRWSSEGPGGIATAVEPLLQIFLVVSVVLAVLEAVRPRALAAVDAFVLPDLMRLRRDLVTFESEIESLQDGDCVSGALAHATREALSARAVCVALRVGGDWHAAAAAGTSLALFGEAAEDARRCQPGPGLLHLAAEDLDPPPEAERLLAAGVEVVACVGAPPQGSLRLLVASRRDGRPYAGWELDFLRSACRRAEVALRNARLAGQLVAAERRATTGRIAVALAHDVGKELDWIVQLAQRLPEAGHDPQRLGRAADELAELAESALLELRHFADRSARASDASESIRVDELVADATQQVARHHPMGRIAVCIAPDVRDACTHAAVTRVLTNALDNALEASADDPLVEVSARRGRDEVIFDVRDDGCGMPSEDAARAFDLGFTTRPEHEGRGVGLALASEIVEAVGGSLQLESVEGLGTRLRVRVPASGGVG